MIAPDPNIIPIRLTAPTKAISIPTGLTDHQAPCVAVTLVQGGYIEEARGLARSRPSFDQHPAPGFRPQGALGPRAVKAFCVLCESLRSGVPEGIFRSLPWVIDYRGRALPMDAAGLLSPRKTPRPIEPMPADWLVQAQLIADAFDAVRRWPTTTLDSCAERMLEEIANRTGYRVLPGSLLISAVEAGHCFGMVKGRDLMRLDIHTRDVPTLVDAICERISMRRDWKEG